MNSHSETKPANAYSVSPIDMLYLRLDEATSLVSLAARGMTDEGIARQTHVRDFGVTLALESAIEKLLEAQGHFNQMLDERAKARSAV